MYAAATAAYLFLAPFPSSAGWRAFALFLAATALVVRATRDAEPLDFRRIPRPFAFAAGLWLIVSLASLAWSEHRAYSWEEIQRELMYCTLAFLVFALGTRDARDLRRGVIAALTAALVLGSFEWIRLLFPALPYADRYHAAEGSFSTVLVLAAPLLVIVAWPLPHGLGARPRDVALIGAGIVLVGFASENRMLWLALMLAILVAYNLYRRGERSGTGARLRGALRVAIAVVGAVLVAMFSYKMLRYYPEATSPVDAIAFDARPIVWASAVPPLLERPWLGHGFGREIVGDLIERAVRERGPASMPLRHAHNVFFDVLLQEGLVGLCAFTLLLGTLTAAFLRMSARPECRPLGIAGVAMIAGFVAKNLTDDFYFRPSSLVFWALCGLLLGAAAARTNPESG